MSLSRTPAQLQTTTENILRALGTSDDYAREVAGSLVDAQLAGHDSHGLIRLAEYASFVNRGILHPAAQPEIVAAQGAAAVVDGNWGWGQPACHLAVRAASRIASENGVAAVTIRHCNHIGRIGEYVERLADAGLVGLAWCNADPAVAPYGGKSRLLGTNPIAAGIPLGPGQRPVIMDFATAATAEGKLRQPGPSRGTDRSGPGHRPAGPASNGGRGVLRRRCPAAIWCSQGLWAQCHDRDAGRGSVRQPSVIRAWIPGR